MLVYKVKVDDVVGMYTRVYNLYLNNFYVVNDSGLPCVIKPMRVGKIVLPSIDGKELLVSNLNGYFEDMLSTKLDRPILKCTIPKLCMYDLMVTSNLVNSAYLVKHRGYYEVVIVDDYSSVLGSVLPKYMDKSYKVKELRGIEPSPDFDSIIHYLSVANRNFKGIDVLKVCIEMGDFVFYAYYRGNIIGKYKNLDDELLRKEICSLSALVDLGIKEIYIMCKGYNRYISIKDGIGIVY